MGELRFVGVVVHAGDPVEYARRLAASTLQVPEDQVDLDGIVFTVDPDGSTVLSGTAKTC